MCPTGWGISCILRQAAQGWGWRRQQTWEGHGDSFGHSCGLRKYFYPKGLNSDGCMSGPVECCSLFFREEEKRGRVEQRGRGAEGGGGWRDCVGWLSSHWTQSTLSLSQERTWQGANLPMLNEVIFMRDAFRCCSVAEQVFHFVLDKDGQSQRQSWLEETRKSQTLCMSDNRVSYPIISTPPPPHRCYIDRDYLKPSTLGG